MYEYMTYKRKLVPQMPHQGWHRAKVIKLKEGKLANTKRGLSETALITFQTDNNCILTQSYLLESGLNFQVKKLFDKTVGYGQGELDLEELLGKRCDIKVEHKIWNDRVFANVVDVCLINGH